MEPLSALSSVVPLAEAVPKDYWQAHNFAARIHREFVVHQEKGNIAEMRRRFFLLARYYGRTLGILREALRRGNIALINVALRNLMALHQPLYSMREVSPTTVPLVLTLNRETRRRFLEDLIIRVLQESPTPLTLDMIVQNVHDLHIIFEAEREIVNNNIESLISRGYLQRARDRFSRAKRAYDNVNLDHAGLEALLGQRLYREFEDSGFRGLSDLVNRRRAFKAFFERFTGCGPETAELFIAVAIEIVRPTARTRRVTSWTHSDLIGSIYPRPYQRDAFSIFRGYGYQGQLIEAPTGSGKTLIGMMCIQDWLRTLSRGESILILVPTANYVQQWVAELCYKTIGLQISPDEIFTGTPMSYEAEQKKSHNSPALLIMTYTSLAQVGSPRGKGGFDKVSLEIFIQGSNIQYVILDEVHKVADDLNSVSAHVAKLLTEWLHDGSLRGLIGFSGTAESYRDRFPQLGLQLVYVMPPADLIAYGFVAPFAEFGIPFSYSDREKRVIDLLEQYKSQIKAFIHLVGSENLKNIFRGIPIERRVDIGKNFLDMYEGLRDQEDALKKRFMDWEKDAEFSLNDINLVTIIQLAENLSDRDLLDVSLNDRTEEKKEKSRQAFNEILTELNQIRTELKSRIYFPDISLRLGSSDFGNILDSQDMLTQTRIESKSKMKEKTRDVLASTIVGLYSSLKNFYYRVGEGRLDTINAIIEAEYVARPVTGVIVFDNAKRIKWNDQVAIPGYTGVAGVFAQMLGDPRLTPIAVLSSEIYMPWTEMNSLPSRIADFIKHEIMLSELGTTLFSTITQGFDIPDHRNMELLASFTEILGQYIHSIKNIGAPRPSEFDKRVLNRFRATVNNAQLGMVEEKLVNRLSLENNLVRKLVGTFYDYALIAHYFDESHVAELRQTDGALQKFYVVRMVGGEKKLLMYSLTSRVFDAENLPINVIIVSSWARTGWNVIKPNILIDATATRDVTAWQQLRGRAMRARKSWDKSAYELMTLLLGTQVKGLREDDPELPPDVFNLVEKVDERRYVDTLEESSRQLLSEVYANAQNAQTRDYSEDVLFNKIQRGRLSEFSQKERVQLAVDLMLHRNKVTHIYELVKAYGSTRQIMYNRSTRKWGRIESIAAKHEHEYSVDPFTGQYLPGEAHAPLVYSQDPRENLPSSLRELISNNLEGCDHLIVKGWIQAIISDVEEQVVVE
jgi:superfamily II DNA or RNA helicase